MRERASTTKWRPLPGSLVAGLLVIAGLLLTSFSWWFLLLTAAGAFGPAILRELGWLRDKDEFQLLADYRAGYHAYVTTGLMAFLMVAYFRSSAKTIDHPQEVATLLLATLWFTYFLSSLISFWGAQKAAFRFLVAFGCAWLAFSLASNVGKEWTGWTALLLHPLLAVPFFALAWLSKRWPRLSGGLLLAASAFFVQFFGMFRRPNLAFINQAVTFVFFIGPLLASGVTLLAVGARETETDDDRASESDDSLDD